MGNEIKLTKINPSVLAGFAWKVLYIPPCLLFSTTASLQYFVTYPLFAATISIPLKFARLLMSLRISGAPFRKLRTSKRSSAGSAKTLSPPSGSLKSSLLVAQMKIESAQARLQKLHVVTCLLWTFWTL